MLFVPDWLPPFSEDPAAGKYRARLVPPCKPQVHMSTRVKGTIFRVIEPIANFSVEIDLWRNLFVSWSCPKIVWCHHTFLPSLWWWKAHHNLDCVSGVTKFTCLRHLATTPWTYGVCDLAPQEKFGMPKLWTEHLPNRVKQLVTSSPGWIIMSCMLQTKSSVSWCFGTTSWTMLLFFIGMDSKFFFTPFPNCGKKNIFPVQFSAI